MKVKKPVLFLIAGILWCFAGTMVTKTGIGALMECHPWWTYVGAVIIYLIFYIRIFSGLVVYHEHRLLDHPDGKLPWYMFFDKKSYIIMITMMTFGTALRKSGLIPTWFFSFFYTGLGLALASCGIRFLYLVFKHRDIYEKEMREKERNGEMNEDAG